MGRDIAQADAKAIVARLLEHRQLESRCGVEFEFPWTGRPRLAGYLTPRKSYQVPNERARFPVIRERLSEAQNHRCCYCGTRFEESGPFRATLEHVKPKAKGGGNEQANLVVACSRCNEKRGSGCAFRFYEMRLWGEPPVDPRLPPDWKPIGAQGTTLASVWPTSILKLATDALAYDLHNV